MPRSIPWQGPVLAIIGSFGVAALWVLAASALGRQSSWFAVLAAVDAALLLRLGRSPSGAARAAWAVSATVVTVALANFAIAATQIGRMFGLLPLESMLRMGLHHAWTITQLANTPVELAWLAAALVVAVVAAR